MSADSADYLGLGGIPSEFIVHGARKLLNIYNT